MSFTEINRLRKAGQLQEAHEMAFAELQAEPDNIWAKRAMAWVIYEYLKDEADKHQITEVLARLQQIVNLQLPEDEKMVGDQVAWQVAMMMLEMQRVGDLQSDTLDALFALLSNLNYSIPSKAYTMIYKAFHPEFEEWGRCIEFCNWWDYKNFMPDDFQPFVMKDGTKIMALAEQAYIAYSKKLVAAIEKYEDDEPIMEQTSSFITSLETITAEYPEYVWPVYYLVKLYHLTGDTEKALDRMIPFARSKSGEFWIWDQMADLVIPNLQLRLSCLCKSLSCRSAPKYLVNTHEDLAQCCIDLEMFDQASLEIALLVQTRNENRWNIPDQVKYWMEQSWFKLPAKVRPPDEFYRQHSAAAEALLIKDVPEETAVITGYDPEHHMAWFIIHPQLYGAFRLETHMKPIEIGDIYGIRLETVGPGKYRLLSLQPSSNIPDPAIYKPFAGELQVKSGQAFGFCNRIFVAPQLLSRSKCTDGEKISGFAVYVFNEKKKEWGWKAISIEKADEGIT